MLRYDSQYQTQINEFSNLYNLKLNPQNRWIQLGSLLPWDRMVARYQQSFSSGKGAPAVNPRWMIGALIIKHKLNLTDEQTLQAISENPYMQFFLGLEVFHPEPLFSESLLSEVRKRLPRDSVEAFNELIIRASHPDLVGETPPAEDAKPVENKGKLKIDATVADQYIRYPNDLSLVNEARLKTEAMIDQLWERTKGQLSVKPRTYRRVAHKRYLGEAKKKRKSRKSIRKTLRYLLNCVRRNLRHIDKMLDLIGGQAFPLDYKYQRQLWIIHTLYEQQRGMYEQRRRRCPDRIVSISQPHVRPIVRGKQSTPVEFGSKLGLSLTGGYMMTHTLSWDAYNESSDLQGQAEAYKHLFGYYPELIQADKIYPANVNRTWRESMEFG